MTENDHSHRQKGPLAGIMPAVAKGGTMTREEVIGLGIALIFAFARWRFPAVAKHIADSGIAAGVLILACAMAMPQLNYSIYALLLFVMGCLCIGGAAHLALKEKAVPTKVRTAEQSAPAQTTAPSAPDRKKPDSPDRPWVSIEIELVGPLAYDAVGWGAGTRWHIPIKFKLTNTGNTPATNVDFHADIRPFMIGHWPEDQIKDGVPQGQPVPGTDAASELKKLCENVAELNRHGGSLMGKTLFKGQQFEGVFRVNGNPALFDAAREGRGYSGNIVLLACASYTSATDDRLHQTGESFAIYKPDAKIALEDGTVPQVELRLTGQPMGGNFAN